MCKKKCTYTTVTFYNNSTHNTAGDSPTHVTPARCVCRNLGKNGYSGFSFNVEPKQLKKCTLKIIVRATCINQ